MNCVGAAARIFIQERVAFAENLKSSRSELFFKIAIFKHFTNFPKIVRGGVFLLGKIKKLYTCTDVFLRIFSNFSEKSFFQVTASVERKKKSEAAVRMFFKVVLLKYLRKLPGNYSREVLC